MAKWINEKVGNPAGREISPMSGEDGMKLNGSTSFNPKVIGSIPGMYLYQVYDMPCSMHLTIGGFNNIPRDVGQ